MVSYELVQTSHQYTVQGIKERKLLIILGVLIMSEVQFMNLIKNLLQSHTPYCQKIILLVKKQFGKMWEEAFLTYLKQYSKLRQEKYVPLARRRMSVTNVSTTIVTC